MQLTHCYPKVVEGCALLGWRLFVAAFLLSYIQSPVLYLTFLPHANQMYLVVVQLNWLSEHASYFQSCSNLHRQCMRACGSVGLVLLNSTYFCSYFQPGSRLHLSNSCFQLGVGREWSTTPPSSEKLSSVLQELIAVDWLILLFFACCPETCFLTFCSKAWKDNVSFSFRRLLQPCRKETLLLHWPSLAAIHLLHAAVVSWNAQYRLSHAFALAFAFARNN